jgi:hypothetical protein
MALERRGQSVHRLLHVISGSSGESYLASQPVKLG